MTPEEYIEQRLSGIKNGQMRKSNPSNPDTKLSFADFIYTTILSKKFRKYSVSDEMKHMTRNAINLNIQNNEPIKFALPFGSYKLWQFEESPEPDWAELFAMIHYAHWLKPITDVYEPGVWFDFCGDDGVLELMNNIPEADTKKYKTVFRHLIDFIKPHLPENFTYTFSPVSERYASKEEFLADLNVQMEKLRAKGPIPLTERDIEVMKLNIKPKAGADAREINKIGAVDEIDFQKNRLVHDAFMALSKRRPHHKAPDKILVSATPFGNRTTIPVGTTKTSVVKFQTGVGILKKKSGGSSNAGSGAVSDSFAEHIYSPSQLEKATFEWTGVQIKNLLGENFKRIRVV